MTYNFATPVLPLPIAPTQVPSIADCSDGATTGILPIGVAAFTGVLYAERLNELLAMLSLDAGSSRGRGDGHDRRSNPVRGRLDCRAR